MLPPSSSTLKVLLAALAGFLSHTLLFIRGEWHLQAPVLFRVYAGLAFLIFVLEVISGSDGVINSFWTSVFEVIAYAASLATSIVFYRAIFHRLGIFDGPFLARISKLWHVAHVADSKNHVLLSRMHREYGEFVRTGPSEVTVFNPDVLAAIDGFQNHCSKAVFYDALRPELLMNTERDKKLHAQRRRMWDQAFTTQALSGYHHKIIQYAKRLDFQIAQSTGRPLETSSLLYEFSFDLMGDFAFARSPSEHEDERRKWYAAIGSLQKGMALLGPLSPVPWLLHIGLSFRWIPIVHAWHTMISFCKDCIDARLRIEAKSDISAWLIDAIKKSQTSEENAVRYLYGDAITMVIAGSDTVAPTLVFLFYHIARYPEKAQKLREELKTVEFIININALHALPFLNSFIDETLRLFPTTPTGGNRETPNEGIEVAGRYIPGNTTIVAPAYNIGRLESCFVRPNDFVPERWLNCPEMVKNKRAFAPFKQGRHSCVGKKLALAELRFVLALLVSKYKIYFPDGDCGSSVVESMKDCFTAKPGELNLVFEPL